MVDDVDSELLKTNNAEYKFLLLQLARLASHFQSAMERISKVEAAMYGADKREEGVLAKLDKLWEGAQEAKWLRRAMVGALLGHLVAYIWRYLL